ncbi:MAG: hypothetical protein C0500_06125 [Sphingobium sp.]|nr:hypothetical protein [Sphingobium sp.]
MKIARLPALLLALPVAIGLAACSPKAQNETAEAADAITADANAAMSEAAADVDAAGDRALGGMDNAMDSVGNSIDDATEKGKEKASQSLRDASNAVDR